MSRNQLRTTASGGGTPGALTSESDPNAILKSLLDAAGDMIYATANDTPAKLTIGNTADVLTVAGGVPTWAAPAAAGMTQVFLASNFTLADASADVTGF